MDGVREARNFNAGFLAGLRATCFATDKPNGLDQSEELIFAALVSDYKKEIADKKDFRASCRQLRSQLWVQEEEHHRRGKADAVEDE